MPASPASGFVFQVHEDNADRSRSRGIRRTDIEHGFCSAQVTGTDRPHLEGGVSLYARFRSMVFVSARQWIRVSAILPLLSIVHHCNGNAGYSTVTDLARLRGLSTSVPFCKAVW